MTVCARGRLLRKVNKQNKTINKDRHKGMALWSFLLSNCGNLRKRLEALRKKETRIDLKEESFRFCPTSRGICKVRCVFFLAPFRIARQNAKKHTHAQKCETGSFYSRVCHLRVGLFNSFFFILCFLFTQALSFDI